MSDDDPVQEDEEIDDYEQEQEATPTPVLMRRTPTTMSCDFVHTASFRMVDKSRAAYSTSFGRAMGAMEIHKPPLQLCTTPAKRGGQKKETLLVRKRPAAADSDRNLTSAMLGRLRLVCAKSKTYFTADGVTPALVVEFSKTRFGDRHRELCVRVLRECAQGHMSVADCRRMKEELVAI